MPTPSSGYIWPRFGGQIWGLNGWLDRVPRWFNARVFGRVREGRRVGRPGVGCRACRWSLCWGLDAGAMSGDWTW